MSRPVERLGEHRRILAGAVADAGCHAVSANAAAATGVSRSRIDTAGRVADISG